VGTQALRLARERIGTIPVVFCMVMNPPAFGTINGSGVSLDIPSEIKIRELKRILPRVENIGTVYSADAAYASDELTKACEAADVRFVKRKIDSEQELPDALKDLSSKIDCLIMVPDSRIYFPVSVEYLLLESLRKKYAVVGLSSQYTRAGAIISFECDYRDLGFQAGEVAMRILDGESPRALRVLRPRKIKYSVNLLAAERLGIHIAPQAVKDADEVFSK
jgi:putative ABC transport system substrate-binding protein